MVKLCCIKTKQNKESRALALLPLLMSRQCPLFSGLLGITPAEGGRGGAGADRARMPLVSSDPSVTLRSDKAGLGVGNLAGGVWHWCGEGSNLHSTLNPWALQEKSACLGTRARSRAESGTPRGSAVEMIVKVKTRNKLCLHT